VAMASSSPLAPGGSTGRLVITVSKWGWYNYNCVNRNDLTAAMWGRQFWVFFEGETSAPAPFGLTVSGGIGQQPYAPTLGDPADGEFWFAQIQDSGAIGKGTPLDGDLQGSFRFDSKDYELVFTFDPLLEITNNCPPE